MIESRLKRSDKRRLKYSSKIRNRKVVPDKRTILIPCSNTESIDLILYYALPIAKNFNSSLSFLFMGEKTVFESFKTEIEKRFSGTANNDKYRLEHYSSKIVKVPKVEENSIGEEAVMMIFPQLPSGSFSFFKQLIFMMKAKSLHLPYLILQQTDIKEHKWTPDNVIMPISYRRTDKESAAPASYFARYGNSKITILFSKETLASAEKDINNNLKFIRTMFTRLNVGASVLPAKSNSAKLHEEAVNMAHESGNSLVVVTSTRYYGIEHFFTGPMELHTIKNRHKIPVLCINTRNDLLVVNDF